MGRRLCESRTQANHYVTESHHSQSLDAIATLNSEACLVAQVAAMITRIRFRQALMRFAFCTSSGNSSLIQGTVTTGHHASANLIPKRLRVWIPYAFPSEMASQT